jgi:GABA(A) receptor-associated protein
LGHFDNCRFAIDRAKTLNYFRAMLLAKLSLDDAANSIYLFTGKKLLHEGGTSMGGLYDRYKDEDGFLYINYAENNPF